MSEVISPQRAAGGEGATCAFARSHCGGGENTSILHYIAKLKGGKRASSGILPLSGAVCEELGQGGARASGGRKGGGGVNDAIFSARNSHFIIIA